MQLLNATGGTFTLTVGGKTTTAISYNAPNDHSNQPTTVAAAKTSTGGDTLVGTYFYVVTAIVGGVESVASAEATASTDSSNKTISVTWSPVTGATAYNIYRGTSAGAENIVFSPAGTSTTFNDDGTKTSANGTPATVDMTTALTNLPSLGLNGNTPEPGEVVVTGTPGNWTVTFSGPDSHGKHFDTLTGDPGALLNSKQLPVIQVTVHASDTTGDSTQNDLAAKVQNALDAAAIAAGITPGFLTQAITNSPFTAGATFFSAGRAADDQAFEVDVALTATPDGGNTHKGTLAVPATTGNFVILVGSQMTSQIAIGASSALVQAAISGLPGFTDSITVTGSGGVYTLTFGTTVFNGNVGGAVILDGSVPYAQDDTAAHFATALQTAIQSLFQKAGISGGSDVAVGTSTNHVTLESNSQDFLLMFPSPVVVTAGGGRISLTAPQVLHTADTSKPSVSISRSVSVDLDYTDPAFQVLGLGTTPTRLTYASPPATEIDFTLFVNGAQIPIAIADFTGVATINDLANLLQTHIDAALAKALAGGALTAAAQIEVCRPNINPAAGPCDDVGNRITFRGVSGVNSLSIDVPATLADGTTPNGAVTELGFPAITGATSQSRAGTFFLDNVHLTGSIEIVLQDVSATASLGFLSLVGTAAGTLPEQRLLSLTADIRLRNPLVTDSDGCGCQNRLDIGVLINAIRNGHFLYNSDDVHGRQRPEPADRVLQGHALGRLRRRPHDQARRVPVGARRHRQRRPDDQRHE